MQAYSYMHHRCSTNPFYSLSAISPLNAELNPIRHLLALVGARHIVHLSRIRVNTETRLTGICSCCTRLCYDTV